MHGSKETLPNRWDKEQRKKTVVDQAPLVNPSMMKSQGCSPCGDRKTKLLLPATLQIHPMLVHSPSVIAASVGPTAQVVSFASEPVRMARQHFPTKMAEQTAPKMATVVRRMATEVLMKTHAVLAAPAVEAQARTHWVSEDCLQTVHTQWFEKRERS